VTPLSDIETGICNKRLPDADQVISVYKICFNIHNPIRQPIHEFEKLSFSLCYYLNAFSIDDEPNLEESYEYVQRQYECECREGCIWDRGLHVIAASLPHSEMSTLDAGYPNLRDP